MHRCQNKSCKSYNIPVPSALVLEGNFSCYLCKTPFTEDNSRESILAKKIYEDYPSLIARPYAAMLSRTDPESALKRLLDVFTGLLKFLATIIESEYLHSKKLDETLTEIILKDLKTPTLGKWMYFLHTAINEKKLEEFIFWEYREYFLLYYDKLSMILSYRNEFYHTFQGSSEKLKKDYLKYKAILDELLHALPLFSQIYLQRKDKSIFVMQGLSPTLIEKCPLTFEDSEALFWDGENRQLSLFPLHAVDDAKSSNSYIYVASTDKRIIYEGFRGESLDTVRTQKRWKELLSRKTPKRIILKDDKDKELITRMQEETRNTIKGLFEMGKYNPEKFVHRVYPEREINRYLQSNIAGLMVIANSGGGKSSLFSYYADELVRQNIPVLFLQGRQLNDESIEAQLQAILDMDFDLSNAMRNYEFLPDKTYRGILIIDAINEAQNPERVLQGILKFTEELKDSECKIILSLREDFWNGINEKEKKEKYNLNNLFTPLGENFEPEKEPVLQLNSLTREERNSLYKNYGGVRKNLKEIENNNRPLWDYLQSPLHIFFYCAVESSFKDISYLSPDEIGREYFQSIVIQKKQNIADCLRALGYFLLDKDRSRITLEEAWEVETTKRYLKDRKPDSPFMQLSKADIIREFRSSGITYIIFTYDIYLEESVGLSLLSKPYRGSGKMLAKLNPETGVLHASIGSVLARSTVKKDFGEILYYLDECYKSNFQRDQINTLWISKLGDYSVELLTLLSETIINKNNVLDWKVLSKISDKFEKMIIYSEAEKIYPHVILKLRELENSNDISEVFLKYGNLLEDLGKFKEALNIYEKFLETKSKIQDESHAEIAMCYNNIGSVFESLGNYTEGLNFYQKALELQIRIFGEFHADVALSYNNQGSLLDTIGNYDKALANYFRSLEIRMKTLYETHPDIADSYNNIGTSFDSLGNYNKGLDYKKKSLEIYLKNYGENHPRVATSYNNIGFSYDSLGNFEIALEYKLKSLEIKIKILGENHPKIADSYHNIGTTLNTLGNYSEAIESYNKGIEIYINSFSEEHPSVATIYNSLGNTLDNLASYDKALEYKQKSLNIFKNYFGYYHHNVAIGYNDIGVSYEYIGDYEEALNFYKISLDIRLKILGDSHPQVADSYNNIGSILDIFGEYEEALTYHNKALEIRLNNFGEEHTKVAMTYINIGNSLEGLSKSDSALDYFFKSIKIYLNKLGENHIDVADTYNNIGISYDNIENYEEAIDYYNKSLDIYLNNFDEDHPKVGMCYNNLGNTFNHLEDYENALIYLNKSLSNRLITYQNNHPYIAMSYFNIGSTLNNLGKFEEALDFYKKALEINYINFDENHPDILLNYVKIIGVLNTLEKLEDALYYLNKLEMININNLGDNHIDLISIFNDICNTHISLNNFKEASEYYYKIVEIQINCYGEYFPDVGETYLKIGKLFLKMENQKEALEFFIKCTKIYFQNFDEDDKNIIISNDLIDFCLGKIKDQVTHEEILELRNIYLSKDHFCFRNSFYYLGIIYFDQNLIEKSRDYLLQSLHIYNKFYKEELPSDSIVENIYRKLYFISEARKDTELAKEYFKKSESILKKIK